MVTAMVMDMATVAMVLALPVLSRGHIVSAITVNVNMVIFTARAMDMAEVMVRVWKTSKNHSEK